MSHSHIYSSMLHLLCFLSNQGITGWIFLALSTATEYLAFFFLQSFLLSLYNSEWLDFSSWLTCETSFLPRQMVCIWLVCITFNLECMLVNKWFSQIYVPEKAIKNFWPLQPSTSKRSVSGKYHLLSPCRWSKIKICSQ